MYGPDWPVVLCTASNRPARNLSVIYVRPRTNLPKPACNLCAASNRPAKNLSVIYVRPQTDLPKTSL